MGVRGLGAPGCTYACFFVGPALPGRIVRMRNKLGGETQSSFWKSNALRRYVRDIRRDTRRIAIRCQTRKQRLLGLFRSIPYGRRVGSFPTSMRAARIPFSTWPQGRSCGRTTRHATWRVRTHHTRAGAVLFKAVLRSPNKRTHDTQESKQVGPRDFNTTAQRRAIRRVPGVFQASSPRRIPGAS